MAKAPAPPVSMVLRTGSMRTELKGNIPDALDQLLIAVGGPIQRVEALKKLQATHECLVEWEAEKAAEREAAHV